MLRVAAEPEMEINNHSKPSLIRGHVLAGSPILASADGMQACSPNYTKGDDNYGK
jgi:hypothetical protein